MNLSPSHTKKGPGRVHLQTKRNAYGVPMRRNMTKLGRFLMRPVHIFSAYMIGKSPVGSKKGGF